MTVHGLTDIPGTKVWGKGQKDFKLPWGYVDSQGKVHKQVVFRETTGYQDDMMGNDDLAIGERVNEVLSSTIVKLGDIEDPATIKAAVTDSLDKGLPLTEQDRIAGMIFLRRTAIGELYKFERVCPSCNTPARNRATNLSEVEIKMAPDPKKRFVTVKLPRTQQEAVLTVLTAKGSIAMGRLRPSQKDLMSVVLVPRLVRLGDVTLNHDDSASCLRLVKDLPLKDRNYLRHVYAAMENQVDDQIEVDCKNPLCGRTWKFTLDVGQSFFLELEEEVSPETLVWS